MSIGQPGGGRVAHHGTIDLAEVRTLAPRLATPMIVSRIEAQIGAANLDPGCFTMWLRAGLVVVPPASWFKQDAWQAPINTYLSNAASYTAAVGWDERYASLVAAAGFSASEASQWAPASRPSEQVLQEMIAVRKFTIPHMDENTPAPAPPRLRRLDAPVVADDWADRMRG